MKPFYWLLLFLSFLFIAAILYSPSLGGPFQYDDYAQILDNKVLTGRDLPTLLSSVFRFTAHPDGWTGTRDFVRATFLVNWQWWGEKPLGYRWINLVIHVVNATLVAFLIALLLKKIWISAFAGLLFLVHPLNSQAVAYVAQRFTSVATLFYLLTVIFFGRTLNFWFNKNSAGAPEPRSRDTTTRGRRPREWRAYCWGILSMISALLAYNSKEISVTLPVTLLLYNIYNRYKSYKIYLFLIPFFLLALKIPLQTATAAAKGGESAAANKIELGAFALQQKETLPSRHDYFLTQIHVVGTYLRLAVLPVNQTLDYDYPVTKNFDPKTIALAALHLGLIGTGLWFLFGYRFMASPKFLQNPLKSSNLVGFGLLWFYLTLLPESSIIPIPDVIYEHRAYLPMVGLILAAAAVAAAAFHKTHESHETHKSHVSYAVVAAAWLLILAAATFRRAYIWGNEVRLWADVYAKAPQKPRAVKNYGVVLAATGKYDDGIKLLETAVVLDPDNADYWSNLGTANLRAGRFDSAKDKFLTAYSLLAAELNLPAYNLPLDSFVSLAALDSSPKSLKQAAQYLNDYGVCLVQLGRGDEALASFQKSLLIDPTLYAARLGLGAAYNLQDNIQAATDVFESLVEEYPDLPDAYNNLAVMYKKAGRIEDHDRILKAAPKTSK